MMNDQEQMLADMWHAGVSTVEIGRRVGIGRDAVYKWALRLGLGKRERKFKDLTPDPTPAEILQRAKECREAHFAKRRRETTVETDSRLSHERARRRSERLRA